MPTLKKFLDAGLITRDNAQALVAACVRVASKRERSYDPDLKRYTLSLEQAAEGEAYAGLVFSLLHFQWNDTLDLAPEFGIPLDWPAAQETAR